MSTEHDEEKARRTNVAVKALLAVAICGILLGITVPGVLSYLQRREPVDFGARPLVIVSIPPDPKVSGIVTRWTLEKDSISELGIFVASSDPAAVNAGVSVTVVGSDLGANDIHCASGGQTRASELSQLDAGTRLAAQVDAITKNGSETGSFPAGFDEHQQVVTHTEQVTARRWHRDEPKDFLDHAGEVIKCDLPAKAIWHDSGPAASALVPEVDLIRSEPSFGTSEIHCFFLISC
jgi:hypothetical protein